MTNFFNGLHIAYLQCIFIGLSLGGFSLYRKSLNPLYAAGLLISFIFLNTTVLFVLPNCIFYNSGYVNFSGMLLEILWPLTLVFVFKWIDPKVIGLKLPLNKMYLFYGVMLGLFMAILFFIIEKIGFVDLLPKHTINIGNIVFEFLMPGLGEELVYRGVFLAILNHYLGYTWKLCTIRFGWGLLLVSLLFLMAHDVVWTGNTVGIIELLVMAFVYGAFREKTDSIWPSVLCHSFANGVYYLILA